MRGENVELKEAYFKFDCESEKSTFVIKLTDAAKIREARDLLSGKKKTGGHVMGTIIKSPVSYNQPWSFHLDPDSITFFQIAAEVCDASIQYVEDHLEEAGGEFLPGNRWCPWCSRLVEEVNPK